MALNSFLRGLVRLAAGLHLSLFPLAAYIIGRIFMVDPLFAGCAAATYLLSLFVFGLYAVGPSKKHHRRSKKKHKGRKK